MKNKKNRIAHIAFFFVTLFVFSTIIAGKSYAVLLTESMVFMNAKESSSIFKLKNTTAKPQAYRIEWTQLRMNENGGKETIPDGVTVPGVMPANPFVYVAPRRLILQPNQMQFVRFMLKRNRDMPAGEYRSYITIQPEEIPADYTGADQKQAAAATMHVLTGYRIPLFFLNGETTLDLKFTNIRQAGLNDKGSYTVSFTAMRSGTRSALGDAQIICTLPDGGIQKLGTQRIQIFTELSSRNYTTYFTPPPAGCTNLTLQFVPQEHDPLFKGRYAPLFAVPLT